MCSTSDKTLTRTCAYKTASPSKDATGQHEISNNLSVALNRLARSSAAHDWLKSSGAVLLKRHGAILKKQMFSCVMAQIMLPYCSNNVAMLPERPVAFCSKTASPDCSHNGAT